MKKITIPDDFSRLDSPEKLKIVLNYAINVKFTAQFVIDIYNCLACTLTGPWFGLNVELV